MLVCDDCMAVMPAMGAESVDLVLTDIPYGQVDKPSNGLRILDKGKADRETFQLAAFLPEIERICRGSWVVFCGKEQFSEVFAHFARRFTTRAIVWEKTNPAPINGQHNFLSGVELAVWAKRPGATFNAHCRNTVFRHKNGRGKIHPTEKNLDLMKELVSICSNPGDLVFDPCAGSGTSLVAGLELGRRAGGVELDPEYHARALERIGRVTQVCQPKPPTEQERLCSPMPA